MADEQSDPGEKTVSLSDQIHATVQQAWPAATEALVQTDATIANPTNRDGPSTRRVVVSERSVLQANETSGEPTLDAEYELIRELGRGGMGVVYQARQASIGRSVALKMLLPSGPQDAASGRKFVDEAAVTGELDHPNIVPIYDLGRTSQGMLFYAMKEVRGTPWKDVIRRRSLAENLDVLLRVADAVAFAHSRGVIHRDLKPENIMLGEFGEVLVMDWGLALLSADDSETGLGGTPCYMAPEMVLGPISKIGPHSDIYLLAAILFEIVTGLPPHAGKNASHCLVAAARNEITPTAQSGELIAIARRGMATAPEDRYATVQEFRAALHDYQSHTASIAAAKRAKEELAAGRESNEYDAFAQSLFGFQNALDLWDGNSEARVGLTETRVAYAEAALLKGDFELGLSIIDPIAEANATLKQRLLDAQRERDGRQQRLRGLRRTAVGLSVGIVLVMAVALVWIFEAEKQTREQRDIARVQQQLARAAVDQMLTEVGQQQLEDIPQMESVRRSLLNKALAFYLRFLDEQPDDPTVLDETAQAYQRVGDISKMLGQQREAEAAYQKAIGIFQQLTTQFPADASFQRRLAKSQMWLGELYRTLGQSDQAESQYLAALQGQQELVDRSPTDAVHRQELARTSYNLGLLYRSIDQPDQAREAFDNAIKELGTVQDSSIPEPDHQQDLARAYLNRGMLNRGAKRRDDARQDYDRAIEALRALTNAFPAKAEYRAELATALNNLGNLLLLDKSKRDETERVYRDGLALLETLREDFPAVLLYRKNLANAVNSLAALYFYNAELESAEKMWNRSRDLAKSLTQDQPLVPENHSLLGRTLGNLGSVKFKQGDFEAATRLFVDAITSQRAALSTNPDHPEYRLFLRNYTWSLAETHLARKDHASAVTVAHKLPEILVNDPGELYRAAAIIARCAALRETNSDDSLTPTASVRDNYLDDAIELLDSAVEHGYSDWRKLETDEAFKAIRRHKRFADILQRIKKK